MTCIRWLCCRGFESFSSWNTHHVRLHWDFSSPTANSHDFASGFKNGTCKSIHRYFLTTNLHNILRFTISRPDMNFGQYDKGVRTKMLIELNSYSTHNGRKFSESNIVGIPKSTKNTFHFYQQKMKIRMTS